MNTNDDSVTEMVVAIEKEMAAPHKPATLRALRKKYSKLLNVQYGSIVIRLGQTLLRRKMPNGRWMAYELIVHHPTAQSMIGGLELFRLGLGVESWESIDMFATYLVGPAWRDGRINDSFVEYWARSSNKLWKRGALMATIALNKKEEGGAGDVQRTLAVCRMLMDERDDMVVKAMVLALRELVNWDAMAVAKFMEENRLKLPLRVLVEVKIKVIPLKKKSK